MSVFKKATRKQSKLRLALLGPSGAGKTYTALALAKHLGKRVAVIDSERGSASLYAGDVCDFDVLELESFSPRAYVEAIQAAEREGYDVIVTDSLTHAWSGKGGALEMVDNAAKRTQSRNSYMAWRDVTPEHNALVDAMIGCRAHFIATIRVKTAYELQEDDRGKKAPVKIGMAPIQRDGLEYEFTLVGDLDLQHNLMVSKTRCSVFDGAVINRPGEQMALKLLSWLNSGEVAPEKAAPATTTAASVSASTPNIDAAREVLANMMTTGLRECGSRADMVVWARALIELNHPEKKDAWKAWATRLTEIDPSLTPATVAAEAKSLVAA